MMLDAPVITTIHDFRGKMDETSRLSNQSHIDTSFTRPDVVSHGQILTAGGDAMTFIDVGPPHRGVGPDANLLPIAVDHQ